MINLSGKTYWSIVIFSGMVVGSIYIWPDIAFIKDTGAQYRKIAPIGFRDETLYIGRIRSIYNRKGSLANPAIYEHSKDPVIMPNMPEMVNAVPGILSGLDLASLVIISKFILPAALFILITIFAYQMSGLKFASLAAASAVLFGTHLFSRAFLASGRITSGAYGLPLWFSRPITPPMHFLFFLLALIFIYRALDIALGRKVGLRPSVFWIPAGLSLGALFYVSVFYWVYLYAVLAVLFFIYAVKRETVPLKILGAIIFVSLAVSVPYWLENVKTIRDPNYSLLLERFNIGYTHRPIFPAPALGILLLALIMRKAVILSFGRSALYFFISMASAIVLTLNQQVLTGKLFKASHWITYTGKFSVIIIAVLLIALFLKRLYKTKRWTVGAGRVIYASFLGVLLFHAVSMQSNYYAKHYRENLELQDLSGVFSWLRANAGPDDVVLPSPRDIRLSELIPAYTDNFVYYSEPFFCLSLIPAEETRYRMLASYRLFDFSDEEVVQHPYAWDGAIFLTNDTNRPFGYAEREKNLLVQEYKRTTGRDGFDLARRYKLDYIVGCMDKESGLVREMADLGYPVVYKDDKFCVIKARKEE